MRRRIGWYVHHHGAGHAQRALAVARHLRGPVSLLSELPLDGDASGVGRCDGVEVVRLPSDRDEASETLDPSAGGGLHWAPLQPDRLGPRTALLVDWLTRPDVAGLVSDVSVEATTLARLCGVPSIGVRLHGVRHDAAHTLGFALASALLAPYPEALEDPSAPSSVRLATSYRGFLAGDRATRPCADAHRALGLGPAPVVLVALGAGGHDLPVEALAAAGDELGEAQVVVVGPVPTQAGGAVRIDGWVDDIAPYVAAADVVVGTAGLGMVSEVAATRTPFVCVPQDRPFGEQAALAGRLDALGLAIVLERWPRPGEWADVVTRASALQPQRWNQLGPFGSPEATARWIESVFVAGEQLAS